MDKVGSLFGRVLWPSNFKWDGSDMSEGFSHVLTKCQGKIDEDISLYWKGKEYRVRVSEAEKDWEPNFMGLEDDETHPGNGHHNSPVKESEMEEGEILEDENLDSEPEKSLHGFKEGVEGVHGNLNFPSDDVGPKNEGMGGDGCENASYVNGKVVDNGLENNSGPDNGMGIQKSCMVIGESLEHGENDWVDNQDKCLENKKKCMEKVSCIGGSGTDSGCIPNKRMFIGDLNLPPQLHYNYEVDSSDLLNSRKKKADTSKRKGPRTNSRPTKNLFLGWKKSFMLGRSLDGKKDFLGNRISSRPKAHSLPKLGESGTDLNGPPTIQDEGVPDDPTRVMPTPTELDDENNVDIGLSHVHLYQQKLHEEVDATLNIASLIGIDLSGFVGLVEKQVMEDGVL